VAEGDDPEQVEAQLCALLPKERWTRASDALILHGRRVCKPRPLCPVCNVQEFCDYFQSGAAMDTRQDAPPKRKDAATPQRKNAKTPQPKKATPAARANSAARKRATAETPSAAAAAKVPVLRAKRPAASSPPVPKPGKRTR
jgi:adenine-specific DNA glycosylase